MQLEVYENDQLGGDIYWSGEPGVTDQSIAHIHFNPNADENAEVHKKAQWGEILGRLKPENTSEEELVLVGGGAALLLLL